MQWAGGLLRPAGALRAAPLREVSPEQRSRSVRHPHGRRHREPAEGARGARPACRVGPSS